MNFKTPSFSILNKERKEMKYIKAVYWKRVQSEIETYKNDDEEKRDTIKSKDVLILDNIPI